MTPARDRSGRDLLAVFDLTGSARPAPTTIELGFRAHSALPWPGRNDHLIVFPAKTGREAALVDVAKNSVVKRFEATRGRSFYGHGVFSPDGRSFFATEAEEGEEAGLVTVRDTRSFEVTREFDSHGPSPHDLTFLADGKTLCVANSALGHPTDQSPSLTLIESSTGSLVERIQPKSPASAIRHLRVTSGGTVVAIAQSRKTTEEAPAASLLMVFDPKTRALTQPTSDGSNGPPQLAGHTLSIDTDEKGTVAVTSPNGDQVAFWNVNTARSVTNVSVPKPLGIIKGPGPSEYFVTTADGALFTVDLHDKNPTLEPLLSKAKGELSFTGHANRV